MSVAGPLAGYRVVELASEHAAFAGKMLAEWGAEVIVVEPTGGHISRTYEPFVDDVAGPERSLFWWHYNSTKRSVQIDLDTNDGRRLFAKLVATADVVLEGEAPARLAPLGIDHPDLRGAHPALVWCSVTPFGRRPDLPRREEPFTDLTVLTGAGPAWSCGYDDHTLAPVRGGGNQGYQTACLWAVIGILTAVLHREVSGVGQHIDVSMFAASNVTTEAASYEWLVARQTVQRQTGRHAAASVTQFTRTVAADGRDVNTGFPARTPAEYQMLIDWVDELGLRDEFGETFFLEMGRDRGGVILTEVGVDPEATEIYRAAREVMYLIASRVTAHQYFTQAQTKGLACGVIYSPEDVFADEHFRFRELPVAVEHEDLGRAYTTIGKPWQMPASPWRIARAPRIGEHDDEILGQLR